MTRRRSIVYERHHYPYKGVRYRSRLGVWAWVKDSLGIRWPGKRRGRRRTVRRHR